MWQNDGGQSTSGKIWHCMCFWIWPSPSVCPSTSLIKSQMVCMCINKSFSKRHHHAKYFLNSAPKSSTSDPLLNVDDIFRKSAWGLFHCSLFFHGELPPGKEQGGGGGRGEWKIIKNTHFIIFVSFHLHRSSLAASSSFSCTFAPLCSQLLLKTVCVRVLLNECIYGQASSMFGSRPPLKSAPTKWWAVFFSLCLSDPMVLFNRN